MSLVCLAHRLYHHSLYCLLCIVTQFEQIKMMMIMMIRIILADRTDVEPYKVSHGANSVA